MPGQVLSLPIHHQMSNEWQLPSLKSHLGEFLAPNPAPGRPAVENIQPPSAPKRKREGSEPFERPTEEKRHRHFRHSVDEIDRQIQSRSKSSPLPPLAQLARDPFYPKQDFGAHSPPARDEHAPPRARLPPPSTLLRSPRNETSAMPLAPRQSLPHLKVSSSSSSDASPVRPSFSSSAIGSRILPPLPSNPSPSSFAAHSPLGASHSISAYSVTRSNTHSGDERPTPVVSPPIIQSPTATEHRRSDRSPVEQPRLAAPYTDGDSTQAVSSRNLPRPPPRLDLRKVGPASPHKARNLWTSPVSPERPEYKRAAEGSSHASRPHNSEHQRYSWEPGMSDRAGTKRRGNLPKESTAVLNEWYLAHSNHPYPKEEDKQQLHYRTGLTISQISNWFINARRRKRPPVSNPTRHVTTDDSSPTEETSRHGRYQFSLQ